MMANSATVDNLSDLSGDALAAIAEYVPKTSRALMAVALTAPPSSWRERGWTGQPNDAGRAILLAGAASSGSPFESVLEMNNAELKGYLGGWEKGMAREKELQKSRLEEYYSGGWEVLDFMDLEKNLASKLTDDDIGAALACIDARNNLRKLYLTKCSAVVGHGLEPLRGASALEQFDCIAIRLAPMARDNVRISPEPTLSIMGSILTREGSPFRRMKVPGIWLLTSKKENKSFMDFLSGHPHALNMSAQCCYFGFGENKEDYVNNYISQQRDAPTDLCKDCYESSSFTTCGDCLNIVCGDDECRVNGGGNCLACSQCNKKSCSWCTKRGEASVKWCEMDECDDCCDNCRYLICRIGGNDCRFCKGMAFARLLQETTADAAEMERLQAENRELRASRGA